MRENAAPPSEDAVLLGVVTGAHGLKGEVRVKTFTDRPESLGGYGPLMAGDGRPFLIAALRCTRADEVLVRLEGITDRNAADALRGQRLYVPRSALPEPEDDEFYHADLIGLAVEDRGGRRLGTVRAIHNFGGGDMVEIEAADGAVGFVPFTDEAVPTVDLPARRIIVAPPPETDGEEPSP